MQSGLWSKRLIESYTGELSGLQATLDEVERNKKALEGRLKEATSSDQSEQHSERLKEFATRQEQLEKTLKEKMDIIATLKAENNDLNRNYGEIVEKMEESIRIKESISQMDISLTDSVKKSKKTIAQSGSPIKINPGVANPNFLDSDEEEDSFCTPDHTVHKPKQSIMALTLTPSKCGLKA